MSKPATRKKANGLEQAPTRIKVEKQTTPPPPDRPSSAETITYDEITARAYAFFLARGGTHGDDQADWFRAETELRRERGPKEKSPSRNS